MKLNIARTVAIAATTALIGWGGVASASAVDQPERQAGASIPNTKGAVTNWHLAKSSVYGDNLGPGMVSWFTTVYNGSVHTSGLDDDLKAQVQNGAQKGAVTIAATVIEKIGGPFATNKTKVGELDLPGAGTYLVNTQAKFDRKNADETGYEIPTTETYPSLVVRYDDGKDAGTIMGVPVSKAGYVELTGSSTVTITITKAEKLELFGFGYNEDRSAFGGGQITVAGQATAVRVG